MASRRKNRRTHRGRPVQGLLLKRANHALQADVWRIDGPAGSRVRKSFDRQPWFLRRTIGAWITAREVRNLGDLAAIEGIPRLIGRPNPWTFEMTLMEGQDLPVFDTRASVTSKYFDALDAIVTQMHARGISHGDLRRRNLLWDPLTHRPVVLDFAQSLSRRDWLLRPLLPLAFRFDRHKLLRLREWYIGNENLTIAQQSEFRRRIPLLLRLGRLLRRRLYRPMKHWYVGKRPRALKSAARKRGNG